MIARSMTLAPSFSDPVSQVARRAEIIEVIKKVGSCLNFPGGIGVQTIRLPST